MTNSGSSNSQFSHRNPLNLQSAGDDNGETGKLTEEQQLLQEDIDGSHLTKHKRRGAQVRLDFDSDSSDDGQARRERDLIRQQRESRRRAKAGSKNDDSDDMFSNSDDNNADGSDEEDRYLAQREAELVKKSGAVEFLDMDKFERDEEVEVNDNVQHKRSALYDDLDDAEGDGDDEKEEVTESNVDINYFVHPDSDYEDGEKDGQDSDNMEVDGEQRVQRKKPQQEPKLEKFHLRDDMEEGKFDIDGNFIRNAADENAHQDMWLEGLSNKDIAKARKAHLQRRQEDEMRERGIKEPDGDKKTAQYVTTTDYLGRLIEQLDFCETPLEALQNQRRLQIQDKKKQQEKRKKQRRSRKNSSSEGGDENEDDVKARKKIQHVIEEITECVDALMNRGSSDIYSMAREELMREYQKETGERYTVKRKRDDDDVDGREKETNQAPAEPELPNTKNWEFQWEGSDETHGPYDSATMRDWIADSYFDARTSVRLSGTQESFVPYNSVTYD